MTRPDFSLTSHREQVVLQPLTQRAADWHGSFDGRVVMPDEMLKLTAEIEAEGMVIA